MYLGQCASGGNNLKVLGGLGNSAASDCRRDWKDGLEVWQLEEPGFWGWGGWVGGGGFVCSLVNGWYVYSGQPATPNVKGQWEK